MASGLDFGESLPGLFERPDPVGSLLRTCLASALGERTLCSATWKKRATPAGRWWWVLSMSARPTSGTGSGSWATPVAQPANGTPEDFLRRKRESVARGNTMGICLSDLNMQTQAVAAGNWPTPSAQDGERGAERQSAKDARGSGGTALAGAVTFGQWQTPTTQPARQNSYPDAPHIKRPSLQDQAEGMWPTPCAAEADKIGGQPNYGQLGLNNHPAIRGPLAREPLNKSRAGQQDQVRTSTAGKPRGSLNPAWVTQLMGLPDGWLD